MGLKNFIIAYNSSTVTEDDEETVLPYEAEALNLFHQGDFTDAEKPLLNDCIIKLKADGQWPHIHTFIHLGAADETTSRLCIKNPGNPIYTATKSGSPIFTPYVGYKGTGVNTDYLEVFNPNGIISQNSCLFMAWELSDSTDGSQLFGCQDSANEGIICVPKSTTSCITRLNSDGNDTVTQNGRPVGAWSLLRQAAGSYTVRIQKTLKQTYAKTSTSVPNLRIRLLTGNNNGASGTAGTRETAVFIAADGSADYSLIFDAVNDLTVRRHALSL